MLMLTELPEMFTVLSDFSSLNTVKVINVTCMGMSELRGGSELQLIHFNCRNFMVLILMLEMCTVNSHSQGTCVLLEIPSMHKLIQYFQSLYTCRNEDIYERKGALVANIEDDLCSSSVEYCSIANVNSLYQCCCKQCCAIAVYAM